MVACAIYAHSLRVDKPRVKVNYLGMSGDHSQEPIEIVWVGFILRQVVHFF